MSNSASIRNSFEQGGGSSVWHRWTAIWSCMRPAAKPKCRRLGKKPAGRRPPDAELLCEIGLRPGCRHANFIGPVGLIRLIGRSHKSAAWHEITEKRAARILREFFSGKKPFPHLYECKSVLHYLFRERKTN